MRLVGQTDHDTSHSRPLFPDLARPARLFFWRTLEGVVALDLERVFEYVFSVVDTLESKSKFLFRAPVLFPIYLVDCLGVGIRNLKPPGSFADREPVDVN